MGGGQSIVKAQAPVPSAAIDGIEVVQTEAFDEHVTYNEFWDSLVTGFKTEFKRADNHKDGGVRDLSENHFIVYQVTTNKETQQDNMTKLVYRIDKEAGSIYEEMRDPFLDLLQYCGCTRVLQNPLRVEYCRQAIIPDPTARKSGEFVRVFTKKILDKVVGKDVKALCQQPTISPVMQGAQSVVSEPLDDVTDMDTLWDGIVEAIKTQSYNDGLKGEVTLKVEPVDDPADQEAFVVLFDQDGKNVTIPGAYNTGETAATRLFVKAFKPFRSIILQVQLQNFFLQEVFHMSLHTDPELRVDTWRMTPTPVFADEQARQIVEMAVSSAINRVQEK